MKRVLISILITVVVGVSASAQKQSKTVKATFLVDGVCQMCKERIEKAAILTKGVKYAVWDLETKNLYCIYNNKKTSAVKIKQALANAGHDSEEIKASDEAYASIDTCCKYRTLEKH